MSNYFAFSEKPHKMDERIESHTFCDRFTRESHSSGRIDHFEESTDDVLLLRHKQPK